MKNMLRDAAILFVITVVAGAILGSVYSVTKEPIAEQEEKKKQEACQEVFADAAAFEAMEVNEEETVVVLAAGGYEKSSVNQVMRAQDTAGNDLGYVITITSHEGYGGDIQFSMGVRMDGTLNGISILSIAETPGLGMRAEEVLQPQFAEKQVAQFTYTKTGAVSDDQIDAISSATITTNAMTNTVNAGLYYFHTALEGGSGNE
ncbi:RnfABCDGE type electron transport complex subunit G [Lachnospiraceae bacterium JLR.KK008]